MLTDDQKKARRWVVTQDGVLGYVHHEKTDGNLGVRPTTPFGDDMPNQSPHWSPEDRLKHPHEIAVPVEHVRDARQDEIPAKWQC